MTIVVGVDHTSGSNRALEFAMVEAWLRDKDLRIVHAAEPWAPSPYSAQSRPSSYSERADAGRKICTRSRDRAQERLPAARVHTRVVEGGAAKVLVEESKDATMVVVGSRQHGELRAALLGSVSAAVAAHAAGPVVVVRGAPHDPGTGRRIVVGIDGSAHGDTSLRFGFEEAALRRQRLEVVHVWRPYGFFTPSELAQMSTEHEAPLREDVRSKAENWPDVDYRTEVVAGRAAPELVQRSEGTELLVVGHRGSGGALAEMLLGSVSQAVLHHADCPVAIVRHQRQQG